MIRSLSQNDPTSKTYEELTRIMREHLQPTPNEIAQRYVFYKRDRLVGESIKDYVAELRKLSEHCNFADRLEESIRDKLVCGLNDQKIQQKLLAVRNLTLQSAMDTAVAMESAAKNARDLYGGVRGVKNEVGVYSGGNSGGGVNRLDKRSYKGYGNVSVSKKECFRCGGIKHDSDHCTFKSRECFGCKKVGHAKHRCPSLKKNFLGSSGGSSRGNCHKTDVVKKENSMINAMGDGYCDVGEEEYIAELDSGMNFLSLYTLGSRRTGKHDPVMVDLLLNGKSVSMEIDTGAAVTVISEALYSELGDGGVLKKAHLNLSTYTGEVVEPKGVGNVLVEYKDQKLRLPVTVVSGRVPVLLGRDWLKYLKLCWAELFPVKVNKLETDMRVKRIQDKYPDVFSGKLGCLQGFQVNIPVPKDVTPKYFKPRTVPYAMKKRVEEELHRLEEQGVWRRVEYSRWAAPIVPVLKDVRDPAGPIRLCGDYKMTVNQVAPCDNYPIPNTSEQLATLRYGEKFSKLDISHAYQHL